MREGWYSVDFRSSPEVYRSVRLYGTASGSCRFGEVKLVGVEVLNDSNTSVSCPVTVTLPDDSTVDLTAVTYDTSVTPSLDAPSSSGGRRLQSGSAGGISPRFGGVLGGETVTFTGAGFTGTPTVFIDNRECVVDSFTSTEIVCTTADRPYVEGLQPKLEIFIDGVGKVSTRGQVYRYVSRWSDKQTWGNDLPPVEGEAVQIPAGRHLLVDVDSVPRLAFVLVEGSLIFPPVEDDESHVRTFDANYIFVFGGYMEVGTEENPYTSQLVITMHGQERDPFLPIYGNKVTGVRFGQLEMHGNPRSHVWSELSSTADVGDTSITLNIDDASTLDWVAGEKIVIASTDFDGTHAEQRVITSVDATGDNKPILRFAEPLLYKHYAGEETYGSDTLEMRAEVGLLTRNVRYQGDDTSAANQYGAHIMLASPGDESVIGRIENCEFFDVGQAFKLGRYPIHFHMIGTVTKSYIKNNSIH